MPKRTNAANRRIQPSGLTFDHFYAAIELQRWATSETADGLSEADWRRVWVRLTPKYRHVLFLLAGVGLTQAAATAELGTTRGNVTNVARVIRQTISELLTKKKGGSANGS